MIRVLHSFNSEALTPIANWPSSVSVIMNPLSRRPGGHAPITVNTGMPPGKSLTVALTYFNTQGVDTSDEARILQTLRIENLLESLDKVHNDVHQMLLASRHRLWSATARRRMWFPTSLLLETTSLRRTDGPVRRCGQIGSGFVGPLASCRTSLSGCLPTIPPSTTPAASSSMLTLRGGTPA